VAPVLNAFIGDALVSTLSSTDWWIAPMRSLFAVALLLSCPLAQADALADLKQTLSTLNGSEPVNAKLDFTFSRRSGSDDEAVVTPPATVAVDVGLDAAGLRMNWSPATLAAAEAESNQTDPEAKKPVSGALTEVTVTDVSEYLHAAPKLLNLLQQAELLEDKADTWQGQPAHVLSFKLNPPLSKQDQKYVKELDASARIWLDADGVPLAAERKFKVSGRAMLVISFESSSEETFEYQRSGDHLVVLKHHKHDSSSGGGESGQRQTDARLTLAAATPAAKTCAD
jgi:hypothetical protein